MDQELGDILIRCEGGTQRRPLLTSNLSDRDDFLPESLLLSNGEGSSDNGEEVSDEAQGEVQSPGTVHVHGSSQDARFSSPLVNSPKTYPTRTRQPPDRLEL